MCLNDKCADTKYSTTKDRINEYAHGTHPRGYLNLRLYLARAYSSIIESSVGWLVKSFVEDQTILALRLLRHHARLHRLKAKIQTFHWICGFYWKFRKY